MGDKALNDQKFLDNWFIENELWVKADREKDRGEPWRKHYKGPRDRLYRYVHYEALSYFFAPLPTWDMLCSNDKPWLLQLFMRFTRVSWMVV